MKLIKLLKLWYGAVILNQIGRIHTSRYATERDADSGSTIHYQVRPDQARFSGWLVRLVQFALQNTYHTIFFQPCYLDVKLNGIDFLIIFTSRYQGWGKLCHVNFGGWMHPVFYLTNIQWLPLKKYPASRPANMYILLSFCWTSGRLTKTFIHAHVHVYDAFCAYLLMI